MDPSSAQVKVVATASVQDAATVEKPAHPNLALSSAKLDFSFRMFGEQKSE
jgi:hypothetical protein